MLGAQKEKPRKRGAFSGGASRSRTGLNGFAGRHSFFIFNILRDLTTQIDHPSLPRTREN